MNELHYIIFSVINTFITAFSYIPFLGIFTIVILFLLSYKRLPALYHIFFIAGFFSQCNYGLNFWISYLTISSIILFPFLRRNIISRPIILLIKKMGYLPKISQTEKIALTSGSIWVDGQLFSGKPDFKWIFSQNYPSLSKEEKNFIDNEVEQLCKICDDYSVQKNRDLPEKVWKFLAQKKFYGIIIPKKYGGLGFSAYGHSVIIEKLSSRSVPLAITAMVPNSLGPAELLLNYGTKEQRDYYLPRLASGKDLPCFALTETLAGSDATSIESSGELFKDKSGKIKIKLNFSKRYITLGAYATLIGLAFQLRDPNNLLFDNENVGITCALIPNKTKGIIQGRRHDPLATPFINSPIDGKDVIIDIDNIIGGDNGLGNGWKMLMECLAAGRGISLPSTSSGGSKLISLVTSSYCTIRQQFNSSLAKFEGIEEVLARIFSRTYSVDAMKSFTAASVDAGAKPAVISSIAKYHATEIFRQNINDGMDVIGGKGIIRGPNNILANAYLSTPISITVEGANIMTRSLIQFGQGAIMCHPYVYREIEALENNNLKDFDYAFFGHIQHLISNLARSILLSITRGHISKPFGCKFSDKYQRKIAWCSASFALLTDIALAKFGGNLKRKEKLNGRFGDILSAMYIATATLRKFQANGSKKEEQPIVEYAIKEQITKAQYAIEGIYQNIFGIFGKIIFLPFIYWARFNAFTCPNDDKLSHKVVDNIINDKKLRNKLTENIFISTDKKDNVGKIEHAFTLFKNCENAQIKVKKAIKFGVIKSGKIEDVAKIAKNRSIINATEYKNIVECYKAIYEAVIVDDYSLSDYKKI